MNHTHTSKPQWQSDTREFYTYPFLQLIEEFGKEKALEVCLKYKEGIASGRLLYRNVPAVRDGLLFATMPKDWKSQLQ